MLPLFLLLLLDVVVAVVVVVAALALSRFSGIDGIVQSHRNLSERVESFDSLRAQCGRCGAVPSGTVPQRLPRPLPHSLFYNRGEGGTPVIVVFEACCGLQFQDRSDIRIITC